MADTVDLTFAIRAFYGSNAAATLRLYQALGELGPRGELASHLLRAAKTSERAKKYRGGDKRGSFKSQAYATKQWAVANITRILSGPPITDVTVWGWGVDQKLFEQGDPHYHVIYTELPTGQVSFHMGGRGTGPDYPGQWDGIQGKQADRILRFAGRLIAGRTAEAA